MNGCSASPRRSVARPSTTVTFMLQVSGQSSGQTDLTIVGGVIVASFSKGWPRNARDPREIRPRIQRFAKMSVHLASAKLEKLIPFGQCDPTVMELQSAREALPNVSIKKHSQHPQNRLEDRRMIPSNGSRSNSRAFFVCRPSTRFVRFWDTKTRINILASGLLDSLCFIKKCRVDASDR